MGTILYSCSIGFCSETNMASLKEAFILVSSKFKILSLNHQQRLAIEKLVSEKKNVFVNLPTSFGKSLIYQALPLVFDHTINLSGHIVVVVSLLITLMEDQVKQLQNYGIRAVNISFQADINWSRIEMGEYSIVFGSPRAWLMNDRWRTMLCNDVYSRNLCAVAIDEAHVIKQW